MNSAVGKLPETLVRALHSLRRTLLDEFPPRTDRDEVIGLIDSILESGDLRDLNKLVQWVENNHTVPA